MNDLTKLFEIALEQAQIITRQLEIAQGESPNNREMFLYLRYLETIENNAETLKRIAAHLVKNHKENIKNI